MNVNLSVNNNIYTAHFSDNGFLYGNFQKDWPDFMAYLMIFAARQLMSFDEEFEDEMEIFYNSPVLIDNCKQQAIKSGKSF